MKRTLQSVAALALALLTILCAGCAQRSAVPAAAVPETPAVPAASAPETKAARTDVENNGGYYVRVGETVYFRRYGADALPETATFGEFAAVWGASGGECELMAYTPATGELTPLFAENGTGPLWYGDGGFYLHERFAGESCAAWYALDGKSTEVLGPGVPVGVTEGGLLAVERVKYAPACHAAYTFYRNRTAAGEAEFVSEYPSSYAGVTDAGVFLIDAQFGEDAALTCRLIQLTPEGKTLDLGTLPEIGDLGYCDVQVDRFAVSGDTVAVGVGFYAGTGHFLNGMTFVQATVGREGSVREMEIQDESEDGFLTRLAVNDDGTISAVAALPGELEFNYDSGDLMVYEDGAWRVAAPALCPPQELGSGCCRIEQHMDCVDGTAYVTLASAFASPQDDVGWRAAYALLDMLYLAAEPDGTVKELDCVDHGAELYGDVWFIEGESMALWRQRSSSEEEKYYVPESARLIPIAEDADWVGGWEAVFDGVTGLLDADYDLGEPDYYGYEVPDVEPAGRLCLTLDRDGTITRLAKKLPEDLLSIEFDVPESSITDAVEKLSPESRTDDETALWFWAKLCALEDGVRVRIERTPEDTSDVVFFALVSNAFVADEVVCDVTLDYGEYIAVRASLPWHPEMRVSVSKDGAWGSYEFGEDNYLHLETEESIHPELKLAAYPAAELVDLTEDGIPEALVGTWMYRTPPLEYTATFRIDGDGFVLVSSDEDDWALEAHMDRIFNESWQAPDLLCLSVSDENSGEAPYAGFGGPAGDYLIELFRTDDKEILHLTQANNGDGALSWLLPECENQYDFTLTRDRGVGGTLAPRRGETFTAEVVRYDRERYCLWLQEAEIVDEYEDGSPVWRAKAGAPCLAYPISGKDAILSLRACRDPEFPMDIFDVTVDENGAILMIA